MGGLEPLLEALGACWDGLGGHLGASEPSNHKIENNILDISKCKQIGSIFESKTVLKSTPKRPQNNSRNQKEKCITLLSLLDASWTGDGTILGPSWAQTNKKRTH